MIEESSNTDKKEQDSSSDDEMDKFSAVTKLLSDENLFKAAGITAHKGARHGENQSEYVLLYCKLLKESRMQFSRVNIRISYHFLR